MVVSINYFKKVNRRNLFFFFKKKKAQKFYNMNDERTSSYLVYMINAKSLTQLLFKQPEIVNRDRHQGMRFEKFSVLNICSCIFKQLEFYFRCNQKADHFPTLIKWFPVKFRIYNTVKTFPVYIWLIFTNKSSLLVINY